MPKNKPKSPARRDAEFARDMLEAKKGQKEFRESVGQMRMCYLVWKALKG